LTLAHLGSLEDIATEFSRFALNSLYLCTANLSLNNFLSGLKKLTVKPDEFFLWKEERDGSSKCCFSLIR